MEKNGNFLLPGTSQKIKVNIVSVLDFLLGKAGGGALQTKSKGQRAFL